MMKHFKLIHFLLLVLSGFVLWQLRPLVSFFNTFVANGYTVSIIPNMAGEYINVLIYISLILMIMLLVALLVLLKFKKKPAGIYTFAIIYYAILFIAIIISAGLLNSLEEALWSTTQARIYRDIATIVTLPQYIFIPFWVIRALGFNIKQFNFKNDLEELQLSQSDSEEVEINIGFETYKAKRTLHRFIREFKYYYSENKFIMISILVISLGILIYLFFSNYEVYNQKYAMGKYFNVANLKVKVDDSIITNLNYAGDVISQDKYYLLLKLTITNSYDEEYTLDYSNFLLYGKDNYYLPIIRKSDNFIDYGEAYYGTKVKKDKSKTIVLPYEINKKDINDSYHLEIYNGTSKKSKDYRFKSIQVDLTPVIIDDVLIVQNAKMNEEVNFNATNLNDTKLTITNATITPRYVYTYEICNKNNICNKYNDLIVPTVNGYSSQTLLVLDYNLTMDLDTPYAIGNQDVNAFATNFFKVRYKIDDKSFVSDIVNLTTDKLTNKFVLQTTNAITNADAVDLLVTIRNKSYVINLVSK